MQIEFDAGPPRQQARRIASAPSLINRIQKPPLLDRLGDAKGSAPPKGPKASAPAYEPFLYCGIRPLTLLFVFCSSSGPGPVRTKARPTREKKKPKTMDELDSELDAFMKEDAPATAPAQAAGDVEMAT